VNKDPPQNKIQRLVGIAKEMASNDTYGYSQKPPSGRWGPDFDCSSFIYFIANQAGYDVDIGSDKVRFTGTMLKDFEKAGFQILPFANVGISDLKIGDILLNLALHAEVYVGNGESVSANSAEDGGYVGSEGDQTGTEIDKHPVVTFDKGWDYVLRPSNDEDDEDDEGGDDDVPMYNQPGQGLNGMYPPTTYNPNNMGGYQQGNMQPNMGMNGVRQGYPQGNLGQMNGYSQTTAGSQPNGQMGYQQGYQQGMMPPMGPQGMDTDLCFVAGIEGAKSLKGIPNGRKAVFDEDKPIMFILGFDQQGNVNSINVYQFEECSEEMPQHLSPLMRNRQQMPMGSQNGMMPQANYITREEFDQLKEMVTNGESSKSSNEHDGGRSGQQPNGSRLNARTN